MVIKALNLGFEMVISGSFMPHGTSSSWITFRDHGLGEGACYTKLFRSLDILHLDVLTDDDDRLSRLVSDMCVVVESALLIIPDHTVWFLCNGAAVEHGLVIHMLSVEYGTVALFCGGQAPQP